MDQAKIQRVLRLIVLLSGNRIYTVDELAAELEISQRTVYRYLDTFKKAGIDIVKVDDYKYRIRTLVPGVKDLSKVVYFSPEEAFIVDRLIDSLDPSNSLRTELKAKLSAIYQNTSLNTFSSRPTSAAKVERLVKAIKGKKVVRLLGYSSSYTGKVEDHLVEPFEMTSDYAGVWAYDLADGINKRFIIVRIEDVEITKEPWANELGHHATPMDDFRIHGDHEYHVILRLNTLAKNLMIEEYPLTDQNISRQDLIIDLHQEILTIDDITMPEHDMENEEEDYWLYDANVRGLDGIGRFVLGLEGNIEVLEGELLIEYLQNHARHISETYGTNE